MKARKLSDRFPVGCYIETLDPVPYAGPCGLHCTLPSGSRARVVEVDNKTKRLKIARLAQSPVGEWWVDADRVKGAEASIR